ncbi:hypothetical protein Ndes2437B_g03491 [Nannochloris sp. 'desiccata']
MIAQPPKRRAILENVLSPKECLELIHVARCCSAVGYRDSCCAVTLTVIARICPQFLPKLASIRERIRDAVEQSLGLELSLLVEFTGLVSWRPGASISWHTDSNRAYLQQRCAAAVAYLNESEHDFQGGNFKFRRGCMNHESEETDGEADESHSQDNILDIQIETIAPRPGLVVAYATSEEHCIDPQIISGERFTLSMWFTTNIEYDEDPKLLATLQQLDTLSRFNKFDVVESKMSDVDQSRVLARLPVAMHALPDGVDIRLCRLACYGICLLKKRKERWVLLRTLEDGEWEREQPLQLGALINSRKGVVVVVLGGANSGSSEGEGGGAVDTSVQQVVVAVQGCLLKSGEAVGCEIVLCSAFECIS